MGRKTIPVEASIQRWRKDPEFRAEYDALEEEFTIADRHIEARKRVPPAEDSAND